MFSKSVQPPKFADSIGDVAFGNIVMHNSIAYSVNDTSWLATTRALLANRIGNDRVLVRAYVADVSYVKQFVSNRNAEDAKYDSCLDIIKVAREGNKEEFERYKSVLAEAEAFREVEDLTRFVGQKDVTASFYIDEASKRFVILVDTNQFRVWHFLQSLTTRYFPWYFKDNPLNEKEIRVVTSLIGTSPDEYLEALKDISSKYDFRTAQIKAQLSGFESYLYETKLSSVQENIRSIEKHLDRLRREFKDAFQNLEESKVTEIGLRTKIENGEYEHEVMEYFLSNKSLNLIDASGNTIEFVVTTKIDSFNPEVFEPLVSNREGYFFRRYFGVPYNSTISDDQVEKLLRAIFETEDVKVRVKAAFTLNFADGEVAAHSYYDYPSEFNQFLPNPHLEHHSCLGMNEGQIYDCMVRHDYIGAIESCVASAKNINLTDDIVMKEFLNDILPECDEKIFELPNGSLAATNEVIAWLEENG